MKKDSEPQIITLDGMMERIKDKIEGNFDIVVAISRGGILPGYLVSRFLNIPMEIIKLNLRDDLHRKIRNEPLLLDTIDFEFKGKRILLTDDVSNSGATLNKAKELLRDSIVTTMVISGNGDISLFGPHDRCIIWPWS